jgi:hypothetical protein
MTNDAYLALDAIHRGQDAASPGLQAWISAFRTVQWVSRTETGYALTPAGREAYNDMGRELGAAPPSARTAPGPARPPRPDPVQADSHPHTRAGLR